MRKLLLAVLAACAALAMAASSASADSSVEVVNESTGAHCTLNPNTCSVTVVNDGFIELTGHLPIFGEVHSSDCNNQYTVNFGENGSGNISGFQFTGGSASCASITACNQPWSFSGEETGPGTIEGNIAVCINTILGTCSGAFDVEIFNTGGHTYGARTAGTQPIGSSLCEVTGEWDLVGSGVEAIH